MKAKTKDATRRLLDMSAVVPRAGWCVVTDRLPQGESPSDIRWWCTYGVIVRRSGPPLFFGKGDLVAFYPGGRDRCMRLDEDHLLLCEDQVLALVQRGRGEGAESP